MITIHQSRSRRDGRRLFPALLLLAGIFGASTVWGQASVQIVHAAPFADSTAATSVTVAANDTVLLEDFRFKDFTDFLEIAAGDFTITVTPTGATEPAISADVTLEDGVEYTLLATGDGANQPLALLPLVNQTTPPGEGNLNLRVIHAAPFAADLAETEVSIRTAGGELINDLAGVPFGVASDFFALPAGTADVKVASPDGRVNLIDPLPVELPAGANISIVAIGDGVNQPLGILALPVGELALREPVDLSVTGWWGTSNSENEGLILQPIPAENRLVGTIYTYDPEGSGTSRWFTFDSCSQQERRSGCPVPGNFDGIATTASVFELEGGQFGDGSSATGELAGELTVEFADCDSGVAALELFSGDVLTWDIRKLVDTVACTLDGRQVTFDLSANANEGAVPAGVEATATFREWPGDRTLVELSLDAGSTGTEVAHAAHIHFNSVAEGGDIAFFLGPIDGLGPAPGASQFIVDESLDTLLEFDGHINIHESNANLGNIVARGDIGANADFEVQASDLNPLPSGRSQVFELPPNPNDGAVPAGVDAEAEFIEVDGTRTLVVLTLAGGSTDTAVSHPAHIHFNSVDEGGDIAIFLGPIDGLGPAPGVSYAIVERSFDELIGFDGHINIHESNAALANIVARGNIGSNAE